MSSFWSGWIIVLTVVNILACFWLIRWTMKKRAGESSQGDVTGHTWDGDLQEYNNPLPRWWLWMFYITLIFGAGYLIYYPGLGNFTGVGNWTQESQYEEEMAKAESKYGPIFKKYAAVAVADLATKEEYQEARAMGKRLFLTYCMQCHGSDARGSHGFPDLADNDWLFGGTPEEIKMSIADGRSGVMPPHGHLEQGDIDNLAVYVSSLSGRDVDAASAEKGGQVYQSAGCLGCHGMDGKGNIYLGAPNLTDTTWLYGGSKGSITKSIIEGRNGVMPAHNDLLGEDKVHLLSAYVYSLSAQ